MARGNIETRGKNTYRIRIYLGTNPDGSQRYYRETIHGTKKQAQIRLTELLRELDTGGLVDRHEMTLGEYLKYWLEKAVVPYKKPKTVMTYQEAIKRLVTKLGHIKLQQLKPIELQEYYAWALTQGKGNGKGYSRSTVSIDHRTMHKALEDAVRWGLIARNVAASVPEKPKGEHRTRDVWTPEQAKRFLEVASQHRLYAMFVLALTSGLRRGELCGLRRQDLRLDEGEIEIHQTVLEVNGKLIIQSTPKTDASETTISISPAVAAILRAHLARQAEERLLLGDRYQDHGLVFCTINGRPLWPSNISKRLFPNLCRKAGVPVIRLHDTRHTFVTMLLDRKAPPHVVQRRARHTSWSTTVNMYAHLTKEVERESLTLTDDILPDTPKQIPRVLYMRHAQDMPKKEEGLM